MFLPDGTFIGVPVAKARALAAEARAEGYVGFQRHGSHPTRGALVPLTELVAPWHQGRAAA